MGSHCNLLQLVRKVGARLICAVVPMKRWSDELSILLRNAMSRDTSTMGGLCVCVSVCVCAWCLLAIFLSSSNYMLSPNWWCFCFSHRIACNRTQILSWAVLFAIFFFLFSLYFIFHSYLFSFLFICFHFFWIVEKRKWRSWRKTHTTGVNNISYFGLILQKEEGEEWNDAHPNIRQIQSLQTV